ncbi:MAG: DUF1697 domain-containing protein [Cyclobacteriaceae bacterium]|nr:DUF1697 domain-containing protein [Cyclobacteriaceae bacterium]
MTTYLAFLRGINVSGQKMIKMEDLRSALGHLDFKNVQTYIQTGNIVFESDQSDAKLIEEKIRKVISDKFQFDVPVVVRSRQEIEDIISKNPFAKKHPESQKGYYFTLLSEFPAQENKEKLNTYQFNNEEYMLLDKTVYFFTASGYGKVKMNNNFFEKILKVEATTRNFNTITKMIKLT